MKDYIFESQTNLVKHWNDAKILWGTDENHVFFSSDGSVGYYIPKKACVVDFRLKGEPVHDISSLIGNENDYEAAQIKFIQLVNKADCKEAAVLNGDSVTAYVNTKYLKQFPSDARFMVKAPFAPVRVYCCIPYTSNYVFAGVVMPMRL